MPNEPPADAEIDVDELLNEQGEGVDPGADEDAAADVLPPVEQIWEGKSMTHSEFGETEISGEPDFEARDFSSENKFFER